MNGVLDVWMGIVCKLHEHESINCGIFAIFFVWQGVFFAWTQGIFICWCNYGILIWQARYVNYFLQKTRLRQGDGAFFVRHRHHLQ